MKGPLPTFDINVKKVLILIIQCLKERTKCDVSRKKKGAVRILMVEQVVEENLEKALLADVKLSNLWVLLNHNYKTNMLGSIFCFLYLSNIYQSTKNTIKLQQGE